MAWNLLLEKEEGPRDRYAPPPMLGGCDLLFQVFFAIGFGGCSCALVMPRVSWKIDIAASPEAFCSILFLNNCPAMAANKISKLHVDKAKSKRCAKKSKKNAKVKGLRKVPKNEQPMLRKCPFQPKERLHPRFGAVFLVWIFKWEVCKSVFASFNMRLYVDLIVLPWVLGVSRHDCGMEHSPQWNLNRRPRNLNRRSQDYQYGGP